MPQPSLTYRQIALLSLPVIFANVTLPIQGLIDIAIIGHLDSSDYLSAVGLATQLFALLLVSFNFLQYASSGLSAQAIGADDTGKLQRVLLRALVLAVGIGVLLILLQVVWLRVGLWFFQPTDAIATLLHDYYRERIWGAPFELANYAFIGWFAGQSQPHALFRQQLLISLSNIVLNVYFVLVLDWHVVGVALGTLLANALGFVYAGRTAIRLLQQRGQAPFAIDWERFFRRQELLKLLRLNRDIWVRTTILTLSFSWITRLSVQQGELILAANVILLQLLTLAAFAIDGIAVTTESQVGQAYGRSDDDDDDNKAQLRQVVKKTTLAAFLVAGLISALFFAIKSAYLATMTDIASVTEVAGRYYGFAALVPVVAALAYQMDGVMFGLTANTAIRNSMLAVAAVFFPLSYVLPLFCGNVGVWLSLYAFFLLRGGMLSWQYTKVVQ